MASRLGGHRGYKLGAIGGAGEPCLYAPLFGKYLVDAPGDGLSAAAIGLWQVEPEFAMIMEHDLPPRCYGEPHSGESVWAAVGEVAICVECCGMRGTPEAYASSTKLGSYADTLSSGGVVTGPRMAASAVRSEDLLVPTKLFVNDELLAVGSGAACPQGGPAQSLAWLANHLNGRGLGLKRGQLIATGQTCNTQAVKAGDRVKATFGGLGSLEMVVAP